MTTNQKFALGCTATATIPIVLVALLVMGYFVKCLNDARVDRHLSWTGVIEKWRAESKAEQDREYKESHMTEAEKDEAEASEAKLWGNPAIAHGLRLEREQRRRLEANRIGWGTVAQILFFGAIMYLIPSIVAIVKKHPQKISILALNILLGWTLLGWAGALVWALIKNLPQNESLTA